jgi:phage-related protein (TIGR01555 family)
VTKKTVDFSRTALIPRKPMGQGEILRRLDGWFSSITGIGTTTWDKRESARFSTNIITDLEAKDMWRGDDLAARIIELVPQEMFRRAFELKLEDKEDSEEVMSGLEDLCFFETYQEAYAMSRALGGSAIYPLINDGSRDLSMPLNLNRLSKIDGYIILEPRELHPIAYYTSPTSGRKLGKPMVFEVRPLSTPAGQLALGPIKVHESRLIIFPGVRVSREQPSGMLQGWGDSVLTRPHAVLRDFNLSWSSAGILLHDFSQAVFKMKGLAEVVAMNRDDVVKMRMQAVELSRSVARALLIDSEEEFERKQTPLSGLPELLDRFATRLSAACEIPVTLLMGQSPAGLQATGDSDIRFFYDSVGRHQKRIDPQVKYGLMLYLRSIDGPLKGKEPDVWSHEWRNLWEPTDKEQAEARQIQAKTDEIYINAQVLSPEEVAVSRFGGDTYSFETHVDFEARARLEPAADSPAKTEQQIEAEEKVAAQLAAKPAPGEEGDDEPTDEEKEDVYISLSQLASTVGVNAKKARDIMRRYKVDRPDAGWKWRADDTNSIFYIKNLLARRR